MRRRLPSILCFPSILCVLCLIAAAPVCAQEPSTAQVPVGDTLLIADTIPSEGASPRAAFTRALIIPGWGHFSIGAHRRGAVYATLQGASWFMLVKTLVKLNDAEDRLDGFESAARDSLNALMASDPAAAERLAAAEAFEAAVAANPLVADGEGLVNARTEQRQDWITYTLFFTMASAVDAYVAAYLKDFPVDVSVDPRPDGGTSLMLRMPIGSARR